MLALAHLPSVSINKALGEIRLEGGGAVDFWSLDFTGRAARGRKYHLVLVDHLIDNRLVVVLRDQPVARQSGWEGGDSQDGHFGGRGGATIVAARR